MKLEPAIKNFLYYFQSTRNPVVWVLGAKFEDAEAISKAIYSGSDEWLTSEATIIDVLADRDGEDMPGDKPLGVDIMLIDGEAAPLRSFVSGFLEKAKAFVITTETPDDVKLVFRAKELVLVDEFQTPEGSYQLTWVRSGSRRG